MHSFSFSQNTKTLFIVVSLIFLFGIVYIVHRREVINHKNDIDVPRMLNKALDECEHSGEDRLLRYRCIRKKAETINSAYDIKSVMSAFDQIVQQRLVNDPAWHIVCHDTMHIFGEEAVRSSQDISRVLGACTRNCGFGCQHGAVSYELRVDPDLLSNLSSLCKPFSGSQFPGQDFTACNHALGHGLADLGKRDLVDALKLCDNLDQGIERTECATGVLMEIYDSPTLDQSAVEFPDNIAGFCEEWPENYRHVCYNNAGGYAFKKTKDIGSAFEACDMIPNEFSKKCIAGIGSDLHFILKGESRKIYEYCTRSDGPEETTPCLQGALGSGFVTDRDGGAGIDLCNVVDPQFKGACFGYMGWAVRNLHGAEFQKQFCEKLGYAENDLCLKAQIIQF